MQQAAVVFYGHGARQGHLQLFKIGRIKTVLGIKSLLGLGQLTAGLRRLARIVNVYLLLHLRPNQRHAKAYHQNKKQHQFMQNAGLIHTTPVQEIFYIVAKGAL